MSDRGRLRSVDQLAALALRYANGELPPEQAAAFEARLEGDGAARDALVDAVGWSATLAGSPPPRPDGSYRQRVHRALLPTATPRTRRAPRRAFAAALTGAVAAGLLALFAAPPAPPTPTPDELAAARPAEPVLAPVSAAAPETGCAWNDSHDPKALVRAHDEEARRRHRPDERGVRPPTTALELRPVPPTMDN